MKRVIRSEVEGRKDRRLERRYQRRYAKRHGYFWLPCSLCGQEHGGHEAGGSVPTTEPGLSEGICPDCTAERQVYAERLLVEHGIKGKFGTTRWGADWVDHRFPTTLNAERRPR